LVILRISPAFGLFRGCCGESETVCTGNGEDIRNAWAIIHDFYIKATLYIRPAYAIIAKNRGRRYDFYANNVRFPIDGDVVVMIP